MDHPSASPRSTPPTSSPASTGAGSEPAASSTTTTTAPPLNPTRADKVLLQLAESVELAARDLYQSVLPEPTTDTSSSVPAGSPLGDYEGLFMTLRENHEEYANSIAGLVGEAAVPRSREVYDQFADRFTTSDVTELAAAAYDLESLLVATHPEVIGELVGTDGAAALAAAVIVEARQASALAAVAGKLDDLDVMLVNSAEPVSLAGASDRLAGATATTEG